MCGFIQSIQNDDLGLEGDRTSETNPSNCTRLGFFALSCTPHSLTHSHRGEVIPAGSQSPFRMEPGIPHCRHFEKRARIIKVRFRKLVPRVTLAKLRFGPRFQAGERGTSICERQRKGVLTYTRLLSGWLAARDRRFLSLVTGGDDGQKPAH